jgi:hypothetical protein
MTLKSDVNDLIQLSESRGWAKINKVMHDEMLLSVPERLIHKLEGEMAMEQATHSATAEKGFNDG